MADLYTVGVTSGIPSSGTGTVNTINQLTIVGCPISNGSTSAPVIATITGSGSAATSSMNGVVVSISPNSVNANGQATMANSAPVVIASNQSALPITSSSPLAITSSSPFSISSGTFTLSSNPTVILSSNPTVTQSSNVNVSLIPVSAGGLTFSSVILTSGVNATLVSSSPRQVYKIECFNNSANIGYLKVYNLSSVPTVGSSLVQHRIMVPANASGAGVITTSEMGFPYSTGLAYTFTGGLQDSDTTAIVSSAFIVNIGYK